MFAPSVVPLHLGSLHPFEQALVMLLAFGPFLVLGVVVYIVRKRDIEAEVAEGESPGESGPA